MDGSFANLSMLKGDEVRVRVAFVCITNPLSGGANSYERTILEKFSCVQEEATDFLVLVPKQANQTYSLPSTHLASIAYKTNFLDMVLLAIRSSPPGFLILKKLGLKFGRFERLLKRNGIDLVYFLSPNPIAMDLIDTPMINTVWDLGHRDLPEFTEISGDRHFEEREIFYKHVLPKSFRVVVDTPATATKIERIYGVQSSRIDVGGIFFRDTALLSPLPSSHLLFGKKYFLYPAQFWPHKNHIFLLNVFAKCLEQCGDIELVFTGSDKGNLEHIRNTVESLGITNFVRFLGFVTKDEMSQLLVSAHSVVFPSLLGPSNLPPLEALAVGTRSIISNVHSDVALLDPLITIVPTFDLADWVEHLVENYQQDKPKNQFHEIYQVNIKEILLNIIKDFDQRREQWPS